ncbi:VWA domain-containing protein [Acidobacteria bacterium AB60]|nr:VWA domain-containing protein [Acidobacteria bacterium AB60]
MCRISGRLDRRGFGGRRGPVKLGWRQMGAVPGAVLALALGLGHAVWAQAIPDAPAPQRVNPPLSDAAGGSIKPGAGTAPERTGGSSSTGETRVPQQPSTQAPSAEPQKDVQTTPPDIINAQELGTIIRTYTTYVTVPVTVKDNKGKQVAGLTWRNFKVYENGNYEPLKVFSVDAFPLSMAFVVDQSLPRDVMEKVNESLSALQGGLAPYDEIAVLSYSNGAHDQSGGFTGAQSARVPFILSMTKASGTEQLNATNTGPMAGCPIRQNGNCIDPNIQPGRSAGSDSFITIPKDIHTLNDAIFAAAKELATRPKERRRIIYVISDGKENGSKATYKEVLKYLQGHEIAVYGTLVGDSARWGEGYLSRFHLPFTMYDNRLVAYVTQTGGSLDSERNLNGIEKSYQSLAEEARNRYTLVYSSHESPFDGKYRNIDVRVDRPNVEVIARHGYYPSAEELR